MTSKDNLRFLHLSDIHLGCPHYRSFERQRDFFLAFESAIERFALPLTEGGEPQVDFILVCGDMFDSRNIQPITLAQASSVLSSLRDEGILVFAIEGNHDTAQQRYQVGEPSWHDYLAGEGFLIHLQDQVEGGKVILEPWNEDDLTGSYYDFDNGVRVIGSQWYGTRIDTMLEKYAEALAEIPPAAFSIMMLHGGLTDYVGSSSGGAEYERFLSLRPYVDYLALGHIHKKYDRQNWMYNPGSLEVTKINDYFEDHGGFRGTISLNKEEARCEVEHLSAYRRRPVLWLSISCDFYQTPDALDEAIRKLVQDEGLEKLEFCKKEYPQDIEFVPPICYLELNGTLGFPFSEIKMGDLDPWICETLGAMLFRYHNKSTPRNIGGDTDFVAQNGRIDREALEQNVFTRLIANDTRYKDLADPLASWATSLKQEILNEDLSESNRLVFIEKLSEILSGIHKNNESASSGEEKKSKKKIKSS